MRVRLIKGDGDTRFSFRGIGPGERVVVMSEEEYGRLTKAQELDDNILSGYCDACRPKIVQGRKTGTVVYLCQACSNWRKQS